MTSHDCDGGPVRGALRGVHAALDALPLSAYDELPADDLVATCDDLLRLEARVKAHQLAAARALSASRADRRHGASSTGQLLANTFGGDRRSADRLLHQAQRMGSAGATESALARGDVSPAQADVIASTLDGLPDDVTSEQREACEHTLIGDAGRLTLPDLRRRADRIADVFAPEKVDDLESTTLAARERRAWQRTEFWMVDKRDGTYTGGFTIPELYADQLTTMLEAISAPCHAATSAPADDDAAVFDERPTARQRRGHAFCTVIDKVPTDHVPGAGGVGARLTVNVDYDVLSGSVAAATLATGTRISPQEVRRMACDLEIVPLVMGGDSLPLDVGRSRRLFTRHQRLALARRDGGCAFPGCDRPPQWCEAHHAADPWCRGGETDLDEGVLLCAHHHRVIHHDGWQLRFTRDRVPEFIPPAHIDPERRPRRNTRYRVDRRRAA